MTKRTGVAAFIRRWVTWLVGFGLSVLFIVTLFLGREVIFDLERQRTASSDNVQWTLTQVEVEYLSFLNATDHLAHTDIPPNELPQDLFDLRRLFDVFYSRIDTLHRSSLFSELRENPDFSEPLAWIKAYLDRTIPLIDGSDEALIENSEDLWSGADALTEDVRRLSVSGLAYFANISDVRRADTRQTLARLAVLTGVFFLALAALSTYLLFANQSARKRSAELRQTNHRMNTILSTSLDAVIVVNSSGEVLEFNNAAENTFGISFEQAKGQSIGDLIIPSHLRGAHKAGMERMRQGGERHVIGKGRVQLEAMRANGELFPVELALQSAFDGEEEIVIGFIRDISHRVRAEKELISARDRALASEKVKADFLTVMSHEIRTPLNGLLGNLSLLKNSRPTAEQKQFIHNMAISGNVLLKHVDSVLNIARFEAGKLSVIKKPFDLNKVLQDLVDGQSGHAASRGNAFEWQWIGPVKSWISADKQRLEQILLNLVGNAIKFTENGRVTLEVEITDETAEGTPIYEFRVIDTGVGIADEDVEKVFEDFHTHDPSIGRNAEGTGLGLGIARRFAKAMGGEIGVESELGQGSVFWLRIPFEQAEQDKHSKQQTETPQNRSALDLLVVEDNEINLEVIRNMLLLDGHSVAISTNGKAGVEAAHEKRFDAILMDISMPVMDGLTATRHIRSGSGASYDVPIIAVSANVLPDSINTFRNAGMDAFVGKPISVDALRQVLDEVTHRSKEKSDENVPTPKYAKLRSQLGEDSFAKLHARFTKEADAFVQSLDERKSPQDLITLAADAHKVAGSAAVFGELAFRDTLVSIETEIKSGNPSDLTALIKKTKSVWADVQKTPD